MESYYRNRQRSAATRASYDGTLSWQSVAALVSEFPAQPLAVRALSVFQMAVVIRSVEFADFVSKQVRIWINTQSGSFGKIDMPVVNSDTRSSIVMPLNIGLRQPSAFE